MDARFDPEYDGESEALVIKTSTGFEKEFLETFFRKRTEPRVSVFCDYMNGELIIYRPAGNEPHPKEEFLR